MFKRFFGEGEPGMGEHPALDIHMAIGAVNDAVARRQELADFFHLPAGRDAIGAARRSLYPPLHRREFGIESACRQRPLWPEAGAWWTEFQRKKWRGLVGALG